MYKIIPIIISVSLSGFAQLLLKYGLNGKTITLSRDAIFPIISNIFIWLGTFCYGASMFLWFKVLSQFEVSFAYPFMALSFIIVATGGFFLGESFSFYKILGIITILLGIFFITRG